MTAVQNTPVQNTVAQNTVKRKIDLASPVWIPFVINVAFLGIVGAIALYNHIETPSLNNV